MVDSTTALDQSVFGGDGIDEDVRPRAIHGLLSKSNEAKSFLVICIFQKPQKVFVSIASASPPDVRRGLCPATSSTYFLLGLRPFSALSPKLILKSNEAKSFLVICIFQKPQKVFVSIASASPPDVRRGLCPAVSSTYFFWGFGLSSAKSGGEAVIERRVFSLRLIKRRPTPFQCSDATARTRPGGLMVQALKSWSSCFGRQRRHSGRPLVASA